MTDSRRPPTLRDVSEASGVSEMTVSRVLRGSGEVAEATRIKVQEAAERLGYVPNRLAGGLAAGGRAGLVAVIVPSLRNLVFPEVLAGISEGLDGTGLQPVFGVSEYLPEREEQVIRDMLAWRPSAMILAGIEQRAGARRLLEEAGVPIVQIMDTDGEAVDAVVGISHRRAGRLMGAEIARRGYRKVGFLGTKMPLDHRARKRFEGFTEALARAGVEVADQEFYESGSAMVKGREMTQAILGRTPDIDLLYYSNDIIGAGGLLWCLSEGMDVPGKLGLAGFNGLNMLDGLPVRLASMDACRREIGLEAARIVAGRIAAPDGPGRERVELTPALAPGDTLRTPLDSPPDAS